jgi:hypothetical protein
MAPASHDSFDDIRDGFIIDTGWVTSFRLLPHAPSAMTGPRT